ncbi:hypothetical protein ARAM_004919 [Aspergillus rambellii]|uniref:Uncharacterized protein n=1 Tax=Aspergillus rambellii TaxID=308745 RepID=A0A0F8X8P4_9EURO|nr:hypothetical protein ARAM_004919 [Aspergillus rambellii]
MASSTTQFRTFTVVRKDFLNAVPVIHAGLKFKEPNEQDKIQKPYEIRCIPPEGMPRANFNASIVPNVPIYDMRPLVPSLSLDREGFQVTRLQSKLRYEEFFDEEKLKTVYAEEIRYYLLHTLGASVVFFHECVVSLCSNRPGSSLSQLQLRNGDSEKCMEVSAYLLHYTLYEVTKLMGQVGGEKIADLIKTRRYQALKYVGRSYAAELLALTNSISVWKPLRGPVKNWPLALCDAQTVDESDMIAFDEVYADDVLESYQVHYNPNQRWYYLSGQSTDEFALTLGLVLHGAFRHPMYPHDEAGRESIELRALVIY